MKKILPVTLFAIFLLSSCNSTNNNSSSNFKGTVTQKTTSYEKITKSDRVYIQLVKTIGINGTALDIATSNDGKFLYVASGDYGLQIIDISDKESPKLIATYDSYGYVNHVEVINNIAYLSYIANSWENYERLNAYDVSNPYNANYLGYYEGYKSNNHKIVDTVDEEYFIRDNSLVVINKKDNTYDRYHLYSPYALNVCKGYAFVADGKNGISIFKVLNVHVSNLSY